MNKSRAKKGPPRKSRRDRLPTASMCGTFEFEPSEEDWGTIELAYPYLTETDREEVRRIATDFLLFAPFASRAPFVDDAVAWLIETGKAAETFWKATYLRPPSEEKQLAALHAQCLVERRIRHYALPDGMEWHTLQGIMTHVVAAFELAQRDLPNEFQSGFIEGQSWDNFIWALTDFAERRGYPTGASKGADKSASTSPFVAFVRELQKLFPEECRRHAQSDGALAQGITKARRKRRDLKSQKAGS